MKHIVLDLLQHLQNYKDINEEISSAADSKFRNHLLHHDEINVALSVFDEQLSLDEI